MQNMREKELGLPETPFYKNLHIMKNVAKSETFFISKIVEPLWVLMDRFVDGSLIVHRKNITLNHENWVRVQKQAEDKEKEEEKILKEKEEEEK